MFEILAKGRNKKSNNIITIKNKMLQQKGKKKRGKLTFDACSKRQSLERAQGVP
jgi:hypothetical protein